MTVFQDPFIEAKCEYSDCFATNNRSLLPHQDFDAILFHQRPLDKNDLPEKRFLNFNRKLPVRHQGPGTNVKKTIYGRNLRIFVIR